MERTQRTRRADTEDTERGNAGRADGRARRCGLRDGGPGGGNQRSRNACDLYAVPGVRESRPGSPTLSNSESCPAGRRTPHAGRVCSPETRRGVWVDQGEGAQIDPHVSSASQVRGFSSCLPADTVAPRKAGAACGWIEVKGADCPGWVERGLPAPSGPCPLKRRDCPG